MIFKLFQYFNKNKIEFCIINGYENIISNQNEENDIDILLKEKDFNNIKKILINFCDENNYKIVQIFYHDVYAKNIFLFNEENNEFLNLDLYGELSRRGVELFDEKDIFKSLRKYKNIPVLSMEKEFIFYLVKKLDKNDYSKEVFGYLKNLFDKEEKCKLEIKKKFPNLAHIIIESFQKNNYEIIVNNRKNLLNDFDKLKKINLNKKIKNFYRIIKRINNPTGIVISFLGPDGSGKSTIIECLMNERLPFRRKDYFHLKPFKSKSKDTVRKVEEPHKYPVYSKFKSYIKLFYFVYQYNFGWIKNIIPLKIKSSLIVFDRYYDDLLVDYKRYRYGGNIKFAKFLRRFIPKPDIYFILIAEPEIIYERKKEVSFEELKRQINEYKKLADGKRYFLIDVSKTPEEIKDEIVRIMMEKMNERF